jgi:hypothetical protein
MCTNTNSRPGSKSPNQPSSPLFRGPLTKKRLLALPGHFYLISNVCHDPITPLLEIEVKADMSRQRLWELIVDCRVNRRTVLVFSDAEGLQAEKDLRLEITRGWPTIE